MYDCRNLRATHSSFHLFDTSVPQQVLHALVLSPFLDCHNFHVDVHPSNKTLLERSLKTTFLGLCLKTETYSTASLRSVVLSPQHYIEFLGANLELGQINVHRTHVPSAQASSQGDFAGADASLNLTTSYAVSNTAWRPRRIAPYPHKRGRGGRVAPISHRHRSLVLNNKTSQPSGPINENEQSGQKEGYITKHDRHMQLINTSIYDQKTQQRNKAIQETRQQKFINGDQQETQKVQQHIHANASRAANGLHHIIINGIQYSVINGGTKLERVRGKFGFYSRQDTGYLPILGPLNPTRPTPKQANVGGVEFFRTTNGNLLRNGIAKTKR